MKRILIFNVNWLGDVLFSTAVIRNLRYNFPESHIACVIPPRCLPVLDANPYLNEIILFDEENKYKGMWGIWKFSRLLKAKHFDTVYLLHRSFSRGLIAALAGIPSRIGYKRGRRNFLLTCKIAPPDIMSVHRIDYYLGVLKGAGISVKDSYSDFAVRPQDIAAAEEFLRVGGINANNIIVGINPGGNWAPKRWPREYWAGLCKKLVLDPLVRVIITGSPEDKALAQYIHNDCGGKCIVAAGKLSLKEFAALCRRFDVFVSADSGPLHIANSAGAKKIIALFGPTDIKITGCRPADRVIALQAQHPCAVPCYHVDCEDNRCMKAISVDEVFSHIGKGSIFSAAK